MRDDYEAYVEVRSEYGRLAGGERAEVQTFWEHTASETGALHSRLVLRDGTVLAERAPGSKSLHERVKRRLAPDCRCGHPKADHVRDGCEADDCECIASFVHLSESDTCLLEEVASLFGIDT